MRERRAIISAWQSFSARPRSLMYSPLMHFVPVETQMTCASFTSVPVGGRQKKDALAKGQTSRDGQICGHRQPCNLIFFFALYLKQAVSSACFGRKTGANLPVVMTTPARTFLRAWGEVKLSVSSLNLSTTRRETASARTWNHTQAFTGENTDTQSKAPVRRVGFIFY